MTSVELPENVYVSIPRDWLYAFPKEAALKDVSYTIVIAVCFARMVFVKFFKIKRLKRRAI